MLTRFFSPSKSIKIPRSEATWKFQPRTENRTFKDAYGIDKAKKAQTMNVIIFGKFSTNLQKLSNGYRINGGKWRSIHFFLVRVLVVFFCRTFFLSTVILLIAHWNGTDTWLCAFDMHQCLNPICGTRWKTKKKKSRLGLFSVGEEISETKHTLLLFDWALFCVMLQTSFSNAGNSRCLNTHTYTAEIHEEDEKRGRRKK